MRGAKAARRGEAPVACFYKIEYCVPNRTARIAITLLIVNVCVADIELIFPPIYIRQHRCRADAPSDEL